MTAILKSLLLASSVGAIIYAERKTRASSQASRENPSQYDKLGPISDAELEAERTATEPTIAQSYLGKRVLVYFNLHKDCYSVKDVKTGKVVIHADYIKLKDVKFLIDERERQRVIQTKVKNVHSYVTGILEEFVIFHPRIADPKTQLPQPKPEAPRVTYNPYKGPTYYYAATQAPVEGFETLHLYLIQSPRQGKIKSDITGKAVKHPSRLIRMSAFLTPGI